MGVGLAFPSPTRRGKEGVGEGKGKGAPPPFLVLFGLKGRGRASCPGRPLSPSTRAQQGPLVPGGEGFW